MSCPSHWKDVSISDVGRSATSFVRGTAWPMHRVTGYVQNYRDGRSLPSLEEHVRAVYTPEITGSRMGLFVARQWCEVPHGRRRRCASSDVPRRCVLPVERS